MNKTVSTEHAPKAIGPYSQAVVVDGKREQGQIWCRILWHTGTHGKRA